MKAYWNNLRERVAAACAAPGATQIAVAARFCVSVSFVEKLRQAPTGERAGGRAAPPRCSARRSARSWGPDCVSSPMPPWTSCAGGWPRSAARPCVWPRWGGAGRRWTGGEKKSVHAAGRDTDRVRALRAACLEALQTEDFTRSKFMDELGTNRTAAATPAPKVGNGPTKPRRRTAGRT